jgi:hypothetical protein
LKINTSADTSQNTVRYYKADQIKKNVAGCIHILYHTEMWLRKLKGRYHLGDICVDGTTVIKMDTKTRGNEGMDWFYHEQDTIDSSLL